MAWGKVTSLHGHCDTQLRAGIRNEMQRQGRAEAGMAPIGNTRAGAQSPIAPIGPPVQPALAAAARS